MTTHAITSVSSVDALRRELAAHRRPGCTIGFVPTMGALHAGHARLMQVARERCDVVVASCYVNPTQFAPDEDLARYPRTPQHDLAVATDAGVDVLWLPQTSDLYGADPHDATSIRVGSIGNVLDGATRPGHFDGVATVVVRLLAAATPNMLFLGRKDHQQLVVLRHVVRDLLLDVEVVAVDTVREADGLALSSRNAYLDATKRRQALSIARSLQAAGRAFEHGSRDRADILDACRAELAGEPFVDVEYVELVHDGTLEPAQLIDERGAVLLVAARVGTTRLIDNIRLTPSTREARP
jgi:pantoate--beta-alanine ligase